MRPPNLCAPRLVARQRQWYEGRERRMQEPSEPHAFALALLSHAVHAVVPVACANERKPMPADRQTCIERKGAMFEERDAPLRNRRRKKTIRFVGFEFSALEKRKQFVEYERVLRRLDILGDRVR